METPISLSGILVQLSTLERQIPRNSAGNGGSYRAQRPPLPEQLYQFPPASNLSRSYGAKSVGIDFSYYQWGCDGFEKKSVGMGLVLETLLITSYNHGHLTGKDQHGGTQTGT